MNSFGNLFHIEIFGESHGNCVGVLVSGVKPGLILKEKDFEKDLLRRKTGAIGTSPRLESDKVIIDSGVFNDHTTGAPILIRFLNNNTHSKDYENLKNQPRPSHADFVALKKYAGFNDYRGGGTFSGRLTLGIVAAGVIAKKMLPNFKFETSIINLNGESDVSKFESMLSCNDGDSLGGILSLKVLNVPVGLGEPYFDSLESTISHLLFSIGGVKGVEFGIGFAGVLLKGSEFNDVIIDEKGTTKTNHNGGINGGISNGNPIEVKVFIKPTPSISKVQETYNFKSKKIEPLLIEGRHDKAIILRAMVVCEACLAIALCDAMLMKNSMTSL